MGSYKCGGNSSNMDYKYNIVTLLITLLRATHEPPGRVVRLLTLRPRAADCGGFCFPEAFKGFLKRVP